MYMYMTMCQSSTHYYMWFTCDMHVIWFTCDMHVSIQEFALKGCIEKFNSRYYQPDSLPAHPSSISSASGLMGGVGGVASGDSHVATGTANEEEELSPLDLNYLSVLGKEVSALLPCQGGCVECVV